MVESPELESSHGDKTGYCSHNQGREREMGGGGGGGGAKDQ